jgi:cysteinyl-tRNA synthetase
MSELHIYNSLSRKKEAFNAINPPHVGLYVCGPTVYNEVHLGNLRTFIGFDVVYRYLTYLGYKVRYVRNITDVGHLTDDADEGEDKIAKKARLEQLEPMEIVQRYTNDFHNVSSLMNILPPNIEPTATGHIQEQIDMIKAILDNGLGYEVNGSVYFDVHKYNKDHHYGVLSGRNIEDLMASERELDAQDEKRNREDFALWKNATPEHIMRWESPWGVGFPGWHLECSVMSTKYLGKTFDIHGGGMDLKFPHHECEIAQSVGCCDEEPARYWIHTNMLTVNGTKMSKSLGNSFLPHELFSGNHELLDQPYSPMVVRFFMLQTHYSSTLDFSQDALHASKKGYNKLMNGLRLIQSMEYTPEDGVEPDEKVQNQINQLCENCYNAMNDDFNTALTIGHLFNLLKKINSLHTRNLAFSAIGKEVFERMKKTYSQFIIEVLGLKDEKNVNFEPLLEEIIKIYSEAKDEKNYDRVDEIRSTLKSQGILLKDTKFGVDWAFEE